MQYLVSINTRNDNVISFLCNTMEEVLLLQDKYKSTLCILVEETEHGHTARIVIDGKKKAGPP